MRLIFAVLIGAALAANLPPLYGDPFYARPDLRAAAQDVLSGAEPGDLVVHTEDFTGYPFAYYNHGQVDVTTLPDGDRDALASAVRPRARFWYIREYGLMDTTERQTADDDARAYLAGWPILAESEEFGVHIYLVHGRASGALPSPPAST